MADLAQLVAALQKADAAGDTPAATAIAAAIKQARGAAAPAPQPLAASDPSEYDPASPEFRAKYGAASGGTDWQNFWAGAGKATVDLGRGVRQLGAEALDVVAPRGPTVTNLVTGQPPVSRGDELRAQQDQVNANDADLTGTKAGIAGEIAGNLATTLLPAGIAARGADLVKLGRTARAARAFLNPTTYKAAVAAGAAQGALAPVGTQGSRTLDVAAGALTGGVARGVANAVGRIAQPLTKALRPEDSAAVRTLTEAGVPLDAAQRSGSRGAAIVKRMVSDNPLTSGDQAAFVEHQGRQFTKAVLKTIGQDSDSATPDIMDAARVKIGAVFDDVASRNPIPYDGVLNSDIARVSTEAHRVLEGPQYGVIGRQVAEIFKKAAGNDGMIDGEALQQIRTELGKIAATSSPTGHYAGELRGVLEDALQRSASGDDLAMLKVARSQYRRLKQIEGAIDNEGGGMVSPSKLANSLGTKSNRAQSKYGRGDQTLVMLAQAGKRLLPDKFPNSGTAHRLAVQAVAPIIAGVTVGGGDYARGDSASNAVATGLGTAGLVAGGRFALNNPRTSNYLAEGLKAGQLRNALLLPGNLSLPNVAAGSAVTLGRQ